MKHTVTRFKFLHDKPFLHRFHNIALARSRTGVILENVSAYPFLAMRRDLIDPITVELSK